MKFSNKIEEFQTKLKEKYNEYYELEEIRAELEILEIEQQAMESKEFGDSLAVLFPEDF